MQIISRNGIGLIQAIMMILIISGMMMIVLKYASISAKHTSNSFIREQNELFLNSAIEKALLDISFYDRNASNDCLAYSSLSVEKRGISYSAIVDIKGYYLQTGEDLSNCGSLGIQIEASDEDPHGIVLLEIESNATINGTVVSRILRRTLQQP